MIYSRVSILGTSYSFGLVSPIWVLRTLGQGFDTSCARVLGWLSCFSVLACGQNSAQAQV